MAHYLVTGGAGFIGSHLAKSWSAAASTSASSTTSSPASARTSRTCRQSSSSRATSPTSRSRSARSPAWTTCCTRRRFRRCRARSRIPITSNRANIDASLNVLVAARDAGVRRVVYAGSSSAYGNTPTLPKVETMPTAPLSPYALQKLVAEQYCQMFTQLYGLETVTIRYFNVFGPRQDPSSPYSGRDLAVHQRALRGPAADDLRRRRADARLHLRGQRRRRRAARLRRAGGERGGDQRRHRRPHLAQPAVPDGARPDRRHASSRSMPTRAPETCTTRRPTSPRRERLLGYEPTVTFEQGLEQTVAWYRASQVPIASDRTALS